MIDRLKISLIILASVYFFIPSWYTNIPDIDKYNSDGETIEQIKHYIEYGKPSCFYNAGHGLYFWYSSIAYKALGHRLPFDQDNQIILTTRIMTAFVALLTVGLIYEIALFLWGSRAALLSGLFAISFPVFYSYSQTSLYHFHVMFFVTLMIYSFVKLNYE